MHFIICIISLMCIPLVFAGTFVYYYYYYYSYGYFGEKKIETNHCRLQRTIMHFNLGIAKADNTTVVPCCLKINYH